MSDDSKKRQQLKEQLANKAQIVKIESVEKALKFLTSPKKFDFIERATTIPTNKEIETKRFIISFDCFNWKASQFDQFNPSKGKKLLAILEQVAKCEINRFPELRLGRDSVARIPPYEPLFSTVSPDVTKIEETEFCEGRLYYFVTEPRFNIVAVDTKHRNIDK